MQVAAGDHDENEPATAEHTQAASKAVGQDVQSLIEEAENASKGKDWTLAKAKAQEALQLTPGHAAATAALALAEQEQVNAQRFRELEDALKERDFEKAQARLAAIPETSVYRQPAKAKFSRAQERHEMELHDAVALAKRWRDAGKCDDIRALQATWYEEQEFRWLHEQCTSAETQPPSPPVGSENTTRNTPSSAAPAKSALATSAQTTGKPASSDDSYTQLLSKAQDAAKGGLYGQARRLCNEALQVRPEDTRAMEVCIVAACNLSNAVAAKGYYVKLPASRQTTMHRLCLAKGIDLAR